MNGVDQVMVVHPHDCNHQKAEPVANEDWCDLPECSNGRLRGRAQIQHHDRYDDGDHAVAEGFETAGGHFAVGHAENLPRRLGGLQIADFRFEISD
jgi:hypothetical protein